MRALDEAYAFIDALPETLRDLVLAHPSGDLATHVRAVHVLRTALLAGALPDSSVELPWPDPRDLEPVIERWRKLRVTRFTRGEPELVDALIADVLDTLRFRQHRTDELRAEILAQLESLAAQRAAAEAAKPGSDSPVRERSTRSGGLGGVLRDAGEAVAGMAASIAAKERDAKDRERRRQEALRLALEHVDREAAARHDERWDGVVGSWHKLADIFGDLRNVLGLGWDLGAGVLRQAGWGRAAELQRLVRDLPELSELIRMLGRLHETEDDEAVADKVLGPVRRIYEEQYLVTVEGMPERTDGVERSDSISRMLPSETALLLNPTTKLLWHARRFERSLLTYRIVGTDVSVRETVKEDSAARDQWHKRRERGPILVCVDTSGSMHGLPEQVAKAITLEAMRIAYQEKRQCYLYTFSGPGQVAEHELSLGSDGLSQLLWFIGHSFQGGTDVAEPLRRAVERLDGDAWQRADILIISDGEFDVSSRTRSTVQTARKRRSVRVHGLVVGGGERSMAELCDRIHVFQSWDRLGRATSSG